MRITRQQMIEMVKCTGQSIIDRAEDIVGDYEDTDSLYLSVLLESNMDSLPTFDINRKTMPKKLFEYVGSESWVIDGRKKDVNDQD